jgi:hypothetical protein
LRILCNGKKSETEESKEDQRFEIENKYQRIFTTCNIQDSRSLVKGDIGFVRRKRSNRSSFYYNSKSGTHKKNSNEIKSVSTNVNKDGENKKKIINLSKINLVKKDNGKSLQIKHNQNDKKKPQLIKKNKIELKLRNRIPRTIIPYKLNVFESTTCQICNKTINNMSNAIFEKNSQKTFHFECVTGELKKAYVIKPSQRLVYIGNNNFAIIEDIKEDGKMKFRINQKLQYTPKVII